LICGSEPDDMFVSRLIGSLVDIDELVIGALGPALWHTVDLARKHRHCNRDRDFLCLLRHSREVISEQTVDLKSNAYF
jgi:hypothetical protein